MYTIKYKDWLAIFGEIERLKKRRLRRIILFFGTLPCMFMCLIISRYSIVIGICLLFMYLGVTIFFCIQTIFLKCPECNNTFHFNWFNGWKFRLFPPYGRVPRGHQFSRRCAHCGFPLVEEELKIIS